MKIINIRDIKGDEKLATDIFSSATGNVLMTKGTILKLEYVNRLLALGIENVRIDDGINFDTEEGKAIKKEVKIQTSQNVKTIFQQHIYKRTEELEKLCEIAEDIIDDILSEDQVIENIANIRQESNDMYGHSVNVCSLSTLLAIKLKLGKKAVNDIAKGSILHDLGLRYITIPYENVSISQLDDLQKEEYKKHVIYGYDAIKNERWVSDEAKNIILYHHEYINGTGFPFGIKGNRFSESVKIVAVCDSFDKMLSGIGHQKSSIVEAVEYVRINRNILFDSKIADLLLSMVAMYPIGTKVITNENEIGIVIRQNRDFLNRPVIKIVRDKEGKELDTPYEKDLLKYLNVFIVNNV